MNVSDFDYNLPKNLIAQRPPLRRGGSRLLVLDRKTGAITHSLYKNLPEFLLPGDALIINDTRVIPARLHAIRANGAKRELLLCEQHEHTAAATHSALAVYRGTLQKGEELRVGMARVIVDALLPGGMARISSTTPIATLVKRYGRVPLPPYINRPDTASDRRRYQSVLGIYPGSVAAPTASLNITRPLINKIKLRGVRVCPLTLHVGLGTFLPIRVENLVEHKMHSEFFYIPQETIAAIKKTKKNGGRVIAVGTTAARALESAWAINSPRIDRGARSGEATLFIRPGYTFLAVDCLLTNFHAPRSTVLILAAAFAGKENLQRAYQEAIEKKYKFLSYGDSMLIV